MRQNMSKEDFWWFILAGPRRKTPLKIPHFYREYSTILNTSEIIFHAGRL